MIFARKRKVKSFKELGFDLIDIPPPHSIRGKPGAAGQQPAPRLVFTVVGKG
jgi:hypothetical protein